MPLGLSETVKANAQFIVTACNSHYELLAALKDIFAMMDEGLLVRDTTNDADSGWAIKQLRLVSRLSQAQSAILRAEQGGGE